MSNKTIDQNTPDSSDQSKVSKTRRKLLLTGSALAWGAAITSLPGCGGSGGTDSGAGGTTTAPATTPAPGPTSFSAGNTDSSGHRHSFTIQCTDLTGAGKTYTATLSGHTHPVPLSAAQLATLESGGSVTINTTDQHPHTWIITKPANACT